MNANTNDHRIFTVNSELICEYIDIGDSNSKLMNAAVKDQTKIPSGANFLSKI